MRALLLLALAGALCAQACAEPARRAVPRTVIVLWNSHLTGEWRETWAHQMIEMPANHLGLVLEPHDVRDVLPELLSRPDVRGVLTWFQRGEIDGPQAYLRWANSALDAGKRLVILGDFGFDPQAWGPQVLGEFNALLRRIGLRYEGQWVSRTLALHAHPRRPMMGFERPVPATLEPFEEVRAIEPARSYLPVDDSDGNRIADLVVTAAAGGYVAPGYAVYSDPALPARRWMIDPFEFLRETLATDEIPKPDVTTLGGLRIFFSHVDGDGWRNPSEVPDPVPGGEQPARSIDVLIDRILRAYPDLPVSLAPIAGDLDAQWCGDERARQAARRAFSLAQVEAASHTYSHPLDWARFDPEASHEAGAEPASRGCAIEVPSGGALRLLAGRDPLAAPTDGGEGEKDGVHRVARSYRSGPFDLDTEIGGAARHIANYLPAGKRVVLLQWSGNTLAFRGALAHAREAGLAAINGGDTRMDPDFDGIGWIAPLSRWAGGERQIYACASNENTYTAGWSRRRDRFRYVTRTFENTGAPRRLKPVDLYYHVFSADRFAGVEAIDTAIRWVRSQELAPIRTSEYVRIAEGFFRIEFVPAGPRAWKVVDRGALQTVRFDDSGVLSPDARRSVGVLGWSRAGASLYVALDPAVPEPIVALAPQGATRAPVSLRTSRWQVEGLEVANAGREFRFLARGWGRGTMRWELAAPCRRWHWTARAGAASTQGDAQRTPEGGVALDLDPATEVVQARVQCTE